MPSRNYGMLLSTPPHCVVRLTALSWVLHSSLAHIGRRWVSTIKTLSGQNRLLEQVYKLHPSFSTGLGDGESVQSFTVSEL